MSSLRGRGLHTMTFSTTTKLHDAMAAYVEAGAVHGVVTVVHFWRALDNG